MPATDSVTCTFNDSIGTLVFPSGQSPYDVSGKKLKAIMEKAYMEAVNKKEHELEASAVGILEQRLESLGFCREQREAIRRLARRNGMSIISGPAGNGKSTVLKHIMEYKVAGPVCCYVIEDSNDDDTRHTGDVNVYGNVIAEAMRSDMRSNPAALMMLICIMIDEILNPESAVAAIDFALTGHSVWATLHASDAFSIVTRLESLLKAARENDPFDAICDSNGLSGLCNQRLVPLLCPECKRRWVDLSESDRRRSISDDLYMRLVGADGRFARKEDLENVFVRGDTQCDYCNSTGLHGKSIVAETVELTKDILSELRQGNTLKARQIWMEQNNGFSIVDHAVEKVKKGVMDPTIAECHLGVPLTI
jgi:type II secretory ATPase GspE/PulE/Tfp pilus assembly ATPase PilB-like protein